MTTIKSFPIFGGLERNRNNMNKWNKLRDLAYQTAKDHGFHDGDVKEKFDFHVQPNPKAEILDDALAVAGVTREQVLNYPPMGEVYKELVAMLGKYVDQFNKRDKFFLVGYNNASFDNQFLRGFFLQNGDKYFGSWFWSNPIDVMVLATPFLVDQRNQMPNFKQGTVAKTLGIQVDDNKLHDAMYDIEICKSIYDKVCGKY